MKQILLFLLLLISGAAVAEGSGPEQLSRLEAELDSVRREQQSMYQSYQMIKELRQMETQESIPPKSKYPHGMDIDTPPPSYDEVVQLQMRREQRIRQYTDELKSMSEKYLELEEDRKELLEQIRELKQQTP